jgi:hypothetical protein
MIYVVGIFVIIICGIVAYIRHLKAVREALQKSVELSRAEAKYEDERRATVRIS